MFFQPIAYLYKIVIDSFDWFVFVVDDWIDVLFYENYSVLF